MGNRLIGYLAAVIVLTALAASALAYDTSGADRLRNARDWNGLLAYSQAWTQAQPDDATGWFYLGNT
jgi:hypothetical protein